MALAGLPAGCGDDAAEATSTPDAAPGDGSGAPADAAADPPSTDALSIDADSAPAGQFYPCDVEAVLRAKCHTCHTMPPRNGAPMSLLTWAATQNLASGSTTVKIWERARQYVASGYMPYMTSPTGPLTPAEKSTLLAWLEAGAAPAPQPCSAGDAGGQ